MRGGGVPGGRVPEYQWLAVYGALHINSVNPHNKPGRAVLSSWPLFYGQGDRSAERVTCPRLDKGAEPIGPQARAIVITLPALGCSAGSCDLLPGTSVPSGDLLKYCK